MIRNSLLAALLGTALGCTGNPYAGPEYEPPVIEKPVPVAVDCGVEPSVLVFKWRPFEFEVMPVLVTAPETPDTEPEFDTRFTLTPTAYDALGDNMADVEAAVAQLRGVVTFYRKCIEEAQANAAQTGEG